MYVRVMHLSITFHQQNVSCDALGWFNKKVQQLPVFTTTITQCRVEEFSVIVVALEQSGMEPVSTMMRKRVISVTVKVDHLPNKGLHTWRNVNSKKEAHLHGSHKLHQSIHPCFDFRVGTFQDHKGIVHWLPRCLQC